MESFEGPHMASLLKRKLLTLDPEATQSHIKRLHFVYGDDIIYIEAVVDGIQLVRAQTMLEPEEYGPAICYTNLLWDRDITPENEPSIEDIDEVVSVLDISEWTIMDQEDRYDWI